MTTPTQQPPPAQPPAPTPGDPAQQSQQPPAPQPGHLGQQQTNPWMGLLDVTPQPGHQTQLPPGQAGGQPTQSTQFQLGAPVFPQPGAPTGGIDPGQLADLVARAVQSAVDRRVNQLTNPQWQQAHGQPPQQQGQQAQTFTQGAVPQVQFTPMASGPSDADQREARMAAREYLGDRITFGSEAERAMAVDLTTALIPGQLMLGVTPNQAAMAAAQTVADRVTSLRRDYEDRAVRGLRSRGLLNEPPQVPAAMAGSVGMPQGGLPVSTTNQQQIAAKANKLAAWAAEENTQRGWATTPATSG